ncbi:MAG TPA: hypothetical protein DCQ64_05685 [Candidatus Rokubacteria bacterium]|nr:hypothetical protein [Candidatus Rokubacteria bacterium]
MARSKKNGNGISGAEAAECVVASICPVQPTLQAVLNSQQRMHDSFLQFQDERREDHEQFRAALAANQAAFLDKLNDIHRDLFVFRKARLAAVGACTFLWTAMKRLLGVSA